jgi:hypothetical protein
MGINDIIKVITKRINGGESLNDAAKLYDSAKALVETIDKQNKVNPIIQGLEEQFSKNEGKLLTIKNYIRISGLKVGEDGLKVFSVNETQGNYVIMVKDLVSNEELLYRLRREPEVTGFRMYRLSLQNRRNFVTLPLRAIQNPSHLLKEMYELYNG